METGGNAIAMFKALTLASRHATSAVEHLLMNNAGVSLPEYEILAALSASPDGRLRAGELGTMLAWEKSRTSHQVTRMERRGLVSREVCQADLRGTWVRLGDAGKEALSSADAAFERGVQEVLGDLSASPDGIAFSRTALEIGKAVAPRECASAVGDVARDLEVS